MSVTATSTSTITTSEKIVTTIVDSAIFLDEDAENHLASLNEFVDTHELRWRYPEETSEYLRDLAEEASTIVNRVVADGENNIGKEIANDLVKLALYDIVILCDNSSSMVFKEKGGRKKELESILRTVTEITSIFSANRARSNVTVKFINGNVSGKVQEPEDVTRLLKRATFRGETPLGTELKEKVLDGFLDQVRCKQLQKPLLVTVITDGEPEGEDRHKFKEVIRNAKTELEHSTKYGTSALAVQISHVGNSPEAEKFISELDVDPEVGDLIDCVSSFKKEKLEVQKGSGVKLTKGEWVVKLLIGAIDDTYDTLDEQDVDELAGRLQDTKITTSDLRCTIPTGCIDSRCSECGTQTPVL